MEFMVCPTCRSPISSKMDAFLELKKKVINSMEETDDSFIDSDLNQNLTAVFEMLKIEKYCCRMHYTTAQDINDLCI